MSKISIKLLGIGAVSLSGGGKTVYFDAFNEYNSPPELNAGDLICFTHDDSDHFDVQKLVKNINETHWIIGPPSIVKPLWESGKVLPEQVQAVYPNEFDKPVVIEMESIKLTVYNTEHFVGWHNQHVSYLLETGEKSVYITGDSFVRRENIEELSGMDCLIASLMHEESIKRMTDRKHAVYHNMKKLLDLRHKLDPGKVLVNHLINCHWACPPEEMKSMVEAAQLGNVCVPLDEYEEVIL